jgi:hypothetical protein
MSQKTNAVAVRTIGIDTGKNTFHLIGLDQQGTCIGVVEEVVHVVFEFLEGSEHAAFEALFGEFDKEAFDGIELGGRRRGEVEYEPRVFVDPFQAPWDACEQQRWK